MKKRVLVFTLIAAVFVLVGAVFVLGATCESLPNANTLVCGSTPNSAIGYGAVDICGNCHPCGVADGVCPEDFYSSVTNQQGNCRLCPDPDCSSRIFGYVKAGGYPVSSGARIYATFPMEQTHFVAETNAVGYFDSAISGDDDLYSGRMQLYAVFEDYDSEQVFIDLTRGGSHEVNISMEAGSCEADCTGVGPDLVTCRSGCQGINGCEFATAAYADVSRYGDSDALLDPFVVANYCHGKNINQNVTMIINESQDYRWVIKCCTGVQRERVEKDESERIQQSDSIKALTTDYTRVRYNGQWVELVIKHYIAEE